MQKIAFGMISCCATIECCITMTVRLAGLDSQGIARVWSTPETSAGFYQRGWGAEGHVQVFTTYNRH